MRQSLDVDAVRDLMAERGIDTASELARRAGLNPYTGMAIMAGRRNAQPSQVVALAVALGVDRSQILCDGEAGES